MPVAVRCEQVEGYCAADVRGCSEEVEQRGRGFVACEGCEDEGEEYGKGVYGNRGENVAGEEVPDQGRGEGGKDIVGCDAAVIECRSSIAGGGSNGVQ